MLLRTKIIAYCKNWATNCCIYHLYLNAIINVTVCGRKLLLPKFQFPGYRYTTKSVCLLYSFLLSLLTVAVKMFYVFFSINDRSGIFVSKRFNSIRTMFKSISVANYRTFIILKIELLTVWNFLSTIDTPFEKKRGLPLFAHTYLFFRNFRKKEERNWNDVKITVHLEKEGLFSFCFLGKTT